MPKFHCEAVEGGVTPVTLEIVADSREAAITRLNALGLIVSAVVEVPPLPPPSPLLAILTSPEFRAQRQADATFGAFRALCLFSLAALLAMSVFRHPSTAFLGPLLLWAAIECLNKFRTPDPNRAPPP